MSHAAASPVPRRRSFWRHYLPVLLILLGGIAFAAIWLIPGEEWEFAKRVSAATMTVALTVVGCALWFVCLSGIARWWVRLALVVLVAAGVVAAIERVTFSGDMVPTFHFRWEPSQADLLEEHRKHQASAGDAKESLVVSARATDMPAFRGQNRDGIVQGPLRVRDWQAHPPKPRWRQPVGGGYAAFAVQGNRAVTIEQRRDQEAVVCYDTETGRELWAHFYSARFMEPLGGEGPRATPTIFEENVFSVGAKGDFFCLDLKTGNVKWSVNILEDNQNVPWAMSGSPLVYQDIVVVSPGVQSENAKNRGVLAFDRKSGQLRWGSGNRPAGYSSPMIATVAGQNQIVLLDGEAIAGYDLKDGRELWSFEWKTYQNINVAQPLVLEGDRVFVSSGYGVGCAMLQVSFNDGKWSVKELWRAKTMRCKFTSPVYYKGHIYGLDEGILACIDENSGARKWRDGRYGHGQLLLSDDLLVIMAETGKLVLVEATPTRHRELGSIGVFNEKTWNTPAIANGRAYLRNHVEMACYDL